VAGVPVLSQLATLPLAKLVAGLQRRALPEKSLDADVVVTAAAKAVAATREAAASALLARPLGEAHHVMESFPAKKQWLRALDLDCFVWTGATFEGSDVSKSRLRLPRDWRQALAGGGECKVLLARPRPATAAAAGVRADRVWEIELKDYDGKLGQLTLETYLVGSGMTALVSDLGLKVNDFLKIHHRRGGGSGGSGGTASYSAEVEVEVLRAAQNPQAAGALAEQAAAAASELARLLEKRAASAAAAAAAAVGVRVRKPSIKWMEALSGPKPAGVGAGPTARQAPRREALAGNAGGGALGDGAGPSRLAGAVIPNNAPSQAPQLVSGAGARSLAAPRAAPHKPAPAPAAAAAAAAAPASVALGPGGRAGLPETGKTSNYSKVSRPAQMLGGGRAPLAALAPAAASAPADDAMDALQEQAARRLEEGKRALAALNLDLERACALKQEAARIAAALDHRATQVAAAQTAAVAAAQAAAAAAAAAATDARRKASEAKEAVEKVQRLTSEEEQAAEAVQRAAAAAKEARRLAAAAEAKEAQERAKQDALAHNKGLQLKCRERASKKADDAAKQAQAAAAQASTEARAAAAGGPAPTDPGVLELQLQLQKVKDDREKVLLQLSGSGTKEGGPSGVLGVKRQGEGGGGGGGGGWGGKRARSAVSGALER
jgi:hypothetical protein